MTTSLGHGLFTLSPNTPTVSPCGLCYLSTLSNHLLPLRDVTFFHCHWEDQRFTASSSRFSLLVFPYNTRSTRSPPSMHCYW